jgi:hypothetical protein
MKDVTPPKKLKTPKTPKRTGRPHVLTDTEKVERILNAIRLGLSIADACEFAGIAKQTYYEYRSKAETGEEPYKSFSDSLKKALIEREMRLLSNLERHSENWVVSAWRLERMFPEKYGRLREPSGGGGEMPAHLEQTPKWPELPGEREAIANDPENN